EDASWQQKDITSCKKQRVANRGPHAPVHHTLLQCCNETDDRKKMGQRHSKRNRAHDRSSLPKNNASGSQHSEIVRDSQSQRKFLRLLLKQIKPIQKQHTQSNIPLRGIAPATKSKPLPLRFDISEFPGCRRLAVWHPTG